MTIIEPFIFSYPISVALVAGVGYLGLGVNPEMSVLQIGIGALLGLLLNILLWMGVFRVLSKVEAVVNSTNFQK